MSGSVWYNEVALALKKFVTENITIKDTKGDIIPCPFVVRNPEDTGDIKPPCISLYFYDEVKDLERYSPERVILYKNTEKGTATIDEHAKAFNLFFQIDLWSKSQLDINSLSLQWASLFDYKSYFDVIDNKGNKRSCVLLKEEFNKQDHLEKDKTRTFQRTYSYKIWVELDESTPKEANILVNPKIIV